MVDTKHVKVFIAITMLVLLFYLITNSNEGQYKILGGDGPTQIEPIISGNNLNDSFKKAMETLSNIRQYYQN